MLFTAIYSLAKVCSTVQSVARSHLMAAGINWSNILLGSSVQTTFYSCYGFLNKVGCDMAVQGPSLTF